MTAHGSLTSVRVLGFLGFCFLAVTAAASGGGFLSVVETLRDVPIERPEQVLLSGDDRFVYVLGDSALAVFERDAATGFLSFVEAYVDGYGGVAGLSGATSMVLSPDDRFLYAVSPHYARDDGPFRGAVAIFERNLADGTLHLVDVETAGFTGAGEVGDSLHLALTSDGTHLYASSAPDHAVLVFARDAADGGLTFAGATSENVDGGASQLAAVLDAGDRYLYLTQATFEGFYRQSRITVFARDAASGGLTFIEEHVNRASGVDCIDFPTGAILSPDGAHLYVINASLFPYDGDEGVLVAFGRDPATGRLTYIGPQDYPLSPTGAAWNAGGTRLYVTGVAGGAGSTLSEVLVYARDAADGTLELVARIPEDQDQELLGAPSPLLAMALSGDGRHLYAGIFNGKLVAVWEVAADGGLREVTDSADPSGGRGVLRGASRAAVSPDGRHVYVTSTASGGMAVYERDPETGRLGFLQVVNEPHTLTQVEPVAVSGDGRWVYALSNVFARDREGGLLELVPQPNFNVSLFGDDLVPSPDGRHLYVLQFTGDSPVAGYAQGTRGRLQPLGLRIPPPPGRGRLVDATSAAMSADGAYLFAVGTFLGASPRSGETDAVWAFARDAGSGKLKLEAFAEIGPRVFDVRRLAVSPNGRHVYVVERNAGDLLVFRHDRGGKRLLFEERHVNGTGGVVGMDEPSDVAVSPSGHLVYVAGSGSDAVAVFARANGRLVFQDAVRGGSGAGDELVRPQALAVAPGNRHLYVTSERLAAITALTLDCLGGPDELCLDADRFRVDVTWRDGSGEGSGHRVPLASRNSGVFWFFSAENWEMLVKVLDGCQLNGRFWVFAAVTTDVGYDLRVTDTWTGEVTSYSNALGTASPAITDTDALHGCGVERSGDVP